MCVCVCVCVCNYISFILTAILSVWASLYIFIHHFDCNIKFYYFSF